MAFEALANKISDSLIVPTVERITLIRTVSTSNFSIEAFKASAEPCTSALMMTLISFMSSSLILRAKSSSDIADVLLRSFSICFSSRDCAIDCACLYVE